MALTLIVIAELLSVSNFELRVIRSKNTLSLWFVHPILSDMDYVGPVGIEPTTHGLKVRCSTD